MSLTLHIIDRAVENRAKLDAKAQGRRDWRNYLGELAQRTLRAHYGLEGSDLSPKEAAVFLKTHKNTIKNYKKRGYFPGAYYLSRNKLILPYREVLALKERLATANVPGLRTAA